MAKGYRQVPNEKRMELARQLARQGVLLDPYNELPYDNLNVWSLDALRGNHQGLGEQYKAINVFGERARTANARVDELKLGERLCAAFAGVGGATVALIEAGVVKPVPETKFVPYVHMAEGAGIALFVTFSLAAIVQTIKRVRQENVRDDAQTRAEIAVLNSDGIAAEIHARDEQAASGAVLGADGVPSP